MDKKIDLFIKNYKKKNRKRFSIEDLEDYVIKSYRGDSQYLENGGYLEFARTIAKFKSNGELRSIKSSKYNGLNPPLKIRWEIVVDEIESKWDRRKIMQMSDLLDFNYYINNPIYQTQSEWEYIENIYNFLKTRENKQYASLEERSLELFYDEKYLTGRKETSKGKYGILTRLKVSYEDLKMKKYGEMFVYWNRGTSDIKKAIILENHSTFFSYKRVAEKAKTIFGFKTDILIYGGGNKIENSFSFLEEIADINKIEVLYFGDIDPEGLAIYYRLKERYKHIDISLQKQAYRDLIKLCNREYPRKSQIENEIYLDLFLKEMASDLDSKSIEKLKSIWKKNMRIPQELIDYEYLLKVIK